MQITPLQAALVRAPSAHSSMHHEAMAAVELPVVEPGRVPSAAGSRAPSVAHSALAAPAANNNSHAAPMALLPQLPPDATFAQRSRAYMTSPITKGTLLAVGAGLAAGVNMPLLAKLGKDVDVFPAACLLEAGATTLQWTAGWLLPHAGGPVFPLNAKTAALLAAATAFGSISAPSTLLLGLKHTSAASVSLSTNLEPFLAAGGAWLLFKDRPSKYMAAAAVAAVASGALCTVGQLQQAPASGPGLGIAASSAASWAAFDMTLFALRAMRSQYIVGISTAFGALACAALAGATGQSFPHGKRAAEIYALGVGAFGLVDLLLSTSMRTIGPGRAALLFSAVALSSGVGLSCAMGQGEMTPLIGASMGVALLGSLILASEQFGSKAFAPPGAAQDAPSECHPESPTMPAVTQRERPVAQEPIYMEDMV